MAVPVKVKQKVDDFVERLRSKAEDARTKSWLDLKNYIVLELSEENTELIGSFMNYLNSEIEKMRNSNDTNAKKGAIMAIDVLINVDVGNTSKTISRSENHLKDMLAKETDPALLQMTASVIGSLALRAGQAAGNIVDFQNNKAIEELSGERNEKNESRRLAAVLILRELALCTPTLFYQSISRFFDIIFKPIRDPKSLVRVQAVAALRAALGIVAQRENQEELFYKTCYQYCTMEYNAEQIAFEKVKPTRDDWLHGTLLIVEELLRCSSLEGEKLYDEVAAITEVQAAHDKQISKVVTVPRKISIPFMSSKPLRSTSSSDVTRLAVSELSADAQRKELRYESSSCCRLVTEHFNKLCKLVFSMKNNRNAFIQQTLVSLLPRLAIFQSAQFSKTYLKSAVVYLLTLLKRERDKGPLFISLGMVCVAVGKEIAPYLSEILEIISTSLPKDLSQKKQKSSTVEPAIFTCISLLSRAMGNEIHLSIRELIGPMLHVPLSPSLTSSLEDIARHIPSLRRDIKDGLLQVLSLILTGRPPMNPGGPRLAIQSAAVYDNAGLGHDLTNITLALRTLGTFDFEGHSLTKLLRHCAENFLASDNEEVRLEAVKTCSSLLTYTNKSHQSTQAQTVADVLNKLLIVGITDSDADIRRCVLESLNNSQFEQHLAQAENLASLFIALNDEKFEIRGIAMVMIGKLSKKNPAYVMPSLRKVLIQLMAVLEHSGIGRDKEQAANMVYLLVHNAPRIIKPYLDAIVDVLMSKLLETNQNVGVLTAVLEALGGVAEVGGQKMLKYADELLKVIEGMLEDSSSAHKQEVVIRTMGQVVASTGLVVEPYNKFPNLLMILLNMLVVEPEYSVRKEVIRLLGLLGALDPYKHKLNLGKIGGMESAGAVVLSMWEPGGERSDGADVTTNEMLVSMPTSTLDEFYPAVAIACMMRIINEPSLSQFHLEAVSGINTIFKSLGNGSVHYISQVVPACLKVMRENVSVRQFLFTQLSNVISIVKLHIKPYLADIFSIIDITWGSCLETPEQSENLQKTMIDLLRTTVSSIETEFKLYLPEIMPHMLKVFITDKSPQRTVIKSLLSAVQEFGLNLDGYIHLLLPPIMQLLDQQLIEKEVKILALKTVERLTDSLDLSEFASKIIHPIIRLLDSNTLSPLPADLCKQAMATLCSLMPQLGKKYRIFIPMVQKTLHRQKITDARYSSIVREIADGTMFTPAIRTPLSRSNTDADFASTPIRKEKQKIRKDDIIRACRGTTKVSKDDWIEWLRRFNLEVLKLSPDPSLKACYILAQSYQTVAREMFNAAFVSCWTELKEEDKKTLIGEIEKALDGQKIPEITQTLLNLAEFMEHCDTKGALPIRPALLGKQAVDCRAYAKALHYVEEEFHEYIKIEKEGGAKHSVGTSMELMEKLISVNNKLEQSEAARGVLLYAKKKTCDGGGSRDTSQSMLPGGKIPGHFYEKLHQWEEAKRVYEEELIIERQSRNQIREASKPDGLRQPSRRRREATLGRMRCLEELGEWSLINDILEGDDVCSWTKANEELKVSMSRMAASSAWGNDDVTKMSSYVDYIARDTFDGLFYRSVLKILQVRHLKAVHSGDKEKEVDKARLVTLYYSEAHDYIHKARDLLSTELAALATESYNRAYGAMVNVQMLAELEEVIQYDLVVEQRECIREMWWKRMNGCQKTVQDWSKLLRVHSLVLEPQHDSKPWLKFASLCRRNGRMAMSAEILKKLQSVITEVSEGVQLKIQIASLKHDWQDDKLEKGKGLKRLRKFVSSNGVKLSQCRSEGRSLLSKCYVMLGSWTEITYGYTTEKLPEILGHYREACNRDSKWYKAWHAFAYTNFEAVLLYKSVSQEAGEPHNPVSSGGSSREVDIVRFCVDAIEGFFRSISLSDGNSLQDTLRLLTLWFDYGEEGRVYDSLVKGLDLIKIENWLQVIPQLIARIDTNRQRVGKLIHKLLCDISKHHPQALIYPLTVAAKSNVTQRRDAALKILDSMKEHSPKLVRQAMLVSEELIRVAILWHELWHEGLEEASRLYFGDRNVKGMFETLEPLHQMLEKGPQTLKETSFQHAYGVELNEALEWCKKYQRTHNVKELTKAWDSYYHVFRRISKQLPMLTSLELQYVSPKLLEARDLELAVPGTYDTKEVVGIQRVHSSFQVITSKQRPRKLSIYGSNGKEYQFVLKGHEDLRQDERVMQLFGLVNSLLLANMDTCRHNLTIQRYSAIPLSTNSGLLGWVPHCDTLHSLIRDYREKKKILLNIEHRIMMRMAPDYDHLTLMQKVEVFEYALDNTTGDDLAKIIWFKSPTSEVWFDRRTNYTRSLAVMSMVGYVLGLGDRHPSNLMLDRESGKIVHIDFGDCFEVAMSREKFPEKIPFRLTRMLINAMEVTGIDGNYRMTCERVMKVLRDNKDSVMAVLEAFVYDPLLNWWLMEGKAAKQSKVQESSTSGTESASEELEIDSKSRRSGSVSGTSTVESSFSEPQGELVNQKALNIVKRVKDKLAGRDFPNTEKEVGVNRQVELLIEQATSHANLCQCYIGWCPFW